MNVAEVLRAHGLVLNVPTYPQALGTLKPKRDNVSPVFPLFPPGKASSAASSDTLPPGEYLATIWRIRAELLRLAKQEGIDLSHINYTHEKDGGPLAYPYRTMLIEHEAVWKHFGGEP